MQRIHQPALIDFESSQVGLPHIGRFDSDCMCNAETSVRRYHSATRSRLSGPRICRGVRPAARCRHNEDPSGEHCYVL